MSSRSAFAPLAALLVGLLLATPVSGQDEHCDRLDMEVTCSVESPKVLVGDPFSATAQVTNTGTVPLVNVTFALRGASGTRVVGDAPLNVTIDKLEPGESRNLSATFTSDEVGERRIDASAREERGWAAAGCFCGITIEGLPALQVEMIDLGIDREKAGVFEEGQSFVYELIVENDVGTAITPDLQVLWKLPPELEFVSGTGDRGVTVTGAGQDAESSNFLLAPSEVQRFEIVVKVISVPPRNLVQTRASVVGAGGGSELATETESTTLRPATGR